MRPFIWMVHILRQSQLRWTTLPPLWRRQDEPEDIPCCASPKIFPASKDDIMKFPPTAKEDGLITLSGTPPAHCKNLFHLELVKEHNKPKGAPKKPLSAPFFLQWRAGEPFWLAKLLLGRRQGRFRRTRARRRDGMPLDWIATINLLLI